MAMVGATFMKSKGMKSKDKKSKGFMKSKGLTSTAVGPGGPP